MRTLYENNIKYIQTARMIYHEPMPNGQKKIHFRYLGKKNRFGQFYLIRNCFFEPSEPAHFDWVDRCLRDIEIAFRFNKPAIISTHRVNYIGALNRKNRDFGLSQFKKLLSRIKSKWPDVECMTADELGEIISGY